MAHNQMEKRKKTKKKKREEELKLGFKREFHSFYPLSWKETLIKWFQRYQRRLFLDQEGNCLCLSKMMTSITP